MAVYLSARGWAACGLVPAFCSVRDGFYSDSTPPPGVDGSGTAAVMVQETVRAFLHGHVYDSHLKPVPSAHYVDAGMLPPWTGSLQRAGGLPCG